MNRTVLWTALLTTASLVGGAAQASAQVDAALHLFFSWNGDGWHRGSVVDGRISWTDRDGRWEDRRKWRSGREHHARNHARGRAARQARPVPRAPVRIPPGHLPPPGLCRVWVVGVPPGRQARPRPCSDVWRLRPGPDVIILHTPARR